MGTVTTSQLFQNMLLKISTDSIRGKQFDAGLHMRNHGFLVRTFNNEVQHYTLSKIGTPYRNIFENKDAIEKQLDGYLCCDGLLMYDSSISMLIYLYFYRNEFLILDSNLQLLRKVKTVDTVSRAHINVYHSKNGRATTFGAPPVVINKKACVWKGHLFIQSGLLSDNEDRKTFSNNSVTDEYDLKTGKYIFSFYIPHYGKYKVDDFQIYDSLLIAVEGSNIVSYRINYPWVTRVRIP